MQFSKDLASLLEKQQMKAERKYYLSVADINIKLSKIHATIKPNIRLEDYSAASEYIHQYISHATVWHLKFVRNFESPEVALLQIFHLNYIFEHEPSDKFQQQRMELQEIVQCFFGINTFTPDHIERRLQSMLNFIKTKQNK